MLLAGGISVLIGIILPTINGDEYKLRAITVQIVVYALSLAVLAYAPGEATPGRRIVLAIHGAFASVVVVTLVLEFPVYLEYWGIVGTVLYVFWLLAGVLELGAALLGGSRPTRPLELGSGGLTTAFGLLILFLVKQQAPGIAVVASFSLYFIAFGVIWVLIGLGRRRAARAG
jgi:hypothetical protein